MLLHHYIVFLAVAVSFELFFSGLFAPIIKAMKRPLSKFGGCFSLICRGVASDVFYQYFAANKPTDFSNRFAHVTTKPLLVLALAPIRKRVMKALLDVSRFCNQCVVLDHILMRRAGVS